MTLFFFNDTATTEIYTLSLHDALPISSKLTKIQMALSLLRNYRPSKAPEGFALKHLLKKFDKQSGGALGGRLNEDTKGEDRKSTRLNSSHANISYAVFCLKKKNKQRCE